MEGDNNIMEKQTFTMEDVCTLLQHRLLWRESPPALPVIKNQPPSHIGKVGTMDLFTIQYMPWPQDPFGGTHGLNPEDTPYIVTSALPPFCYQNGKRNAKTAEEGKSIAKSMWERWVSTVLGLPCEAQSNAGVGV